MGIDAAVKLYDAARHFHTSWLLEQVFPVADVAEREARKADAPMFHI